MLTPLALSPSIKLIVGLVFALIRRAALFGSPSRVTVYRSSGRAAGVRLQRRLQFWHFEEPDPWSANEKLPQVTSPAEFVTVYVFGSTEAVSGRSVTRTRTRSCGM